jgi:hypothetical protein
MKTTPHPQRSPDNRNVSFSAPKTLIARIDAAAAAERRTRSNYICLVIEQALSAAEAATGPPPALEADPTPLAAEQPPAGPLAYAAHAASHGTHASPDAPAFSATA